MQARGVSRFFMLALAACGAAPSRPVVTPRPAASPPPASTPGPSIEPSPGPAEPAPIAPIATTPAAPTSAPLRTWKVRSGLDDCALGGTVARCRKLLGPDEDFFDHPMFPAIGVQISIDNDLVTEIYIHYLRDEDTKRITLFTGTDPHGIGATSTPDDVLRVYGASPEVRDREPTRIGRWPNARLHTLHYPRQGIRFMFVDGVLGLVMLRAP
jgi:hypothetical protein